MDIITKIFLINWVLVWSVICFDVYMVKGAIKKSGLEYVASIWINLSLLSPIAFIIYKIATW